ncbi:MAG: methyltransferase domain-containing protein [Ferruginibacter sp.]
MPDFSKRSYQKEILDQDDIPFEDIKENMRELNIINQKLGGHSITLEGCRQFLSQKTTSPLMITEIGCGGGDNLAAIYTFFKKINQFFSFTGIDIKQSCIDYAMQQYSQLNATWIANDYREVNFTEQPHIIFSSLFCHHFTNEELIFMLRWMKENSILGFFINDLQRHPLAWFLIKRITKLFSKSYLVKNDAPVSVTRGFTKKEWEQLLKQAGIKNYSVKWKWAFRYLIVVKNG